MALANNLESRNIVVMLWAWLCNCVLFFQKAIRKEIGDAKFCLIVDEACDESMNEQMAIVIRFVDKDDFA